MNVDCSYSISYAYGTVIVTISFQFPCGSDVGGRGRPPPLVPPLHDRSRGGRGGARLGDSVVSVNVTFFSSHVLRYRFRARTA